MTGKGFALVVVAVIVVYGALHVPSAGFVYEDGTWRNGGVWEPGTKGEAQHPEYLRMSTLTQTMTRIPSRALVAWSFYLTPNTGPMVHGVNLAVHLLNAWLLALIVLRLGGPGWLTGALFAVHPLATEAVAYASGRSELLPALAMLGCLWVAMVSTGRHGMRWIGLMGCLYLGLLTKPSFLVVIPLLGWVVYQQGERLHGLKRAAVLLAPIGLVLAWRVLTRPHADDYVPMLRWIGVQAFGLWELGVNSVLPMHLSFDHAWWMVNDGVQAFAALGLVAAAIVVLKLPRSFVTLGIGWFLIALAPRLFVRDTLGWLHEHHAYVGLMGMCLALASLLQREPARC